MCDRKHEVPSDGFQENGFIDKARIMFHDRLHLLSEILASSLPGEDSHLEVTPLGRTKSSEAIKNARDFRESAVSLVLFEEDNLLKTLLIQRPEYEGAHSGQISLPGGKRDPIDLDLRDTALRECEEEVGIARHELFDVGQLTPVFIPVSNFSVFPYVFFHPTIPQLVKDAKEVVDIIIFPVKDICQEGVVRRTTVTVSEKMQLKDVPCFVINEKIVWGATALILNEFRHIIMNSELV